MNRLFPLFLAVLLLVSTLVGCNSSDRNPTTAATAPPETVSPPTSEAPETEAVRNTDSDLLAVLSGNIPVLTEFGISQPLGEYFFENYSAQIIAFTLLDMNGDGENEMVVETDSPAITYGVIHFDGDTAYVYPFGIRQLGRLKADGSFAGSGSAFHSLYMTMDFSEGTYEVRVLAECEYNDGWFTVNGKDATQEEFEQFSREWEQRPGANWIYLASGETEPTEAPADLPYLENIPRAEQPIFRDPSYDSPYIGLVQLAGVYTIVEECWDEEDNLWGRLKSGAGWVDLTDIRNPTCPISAAFGEDALLEEGFHHFTLDTPDQPLSLLLRPDETLLDFRLTQVDISTGEAVLTDTLFSLDQLTPDAPLVARLTFPGDMSCYGILYKDMSGTEYRYILSLSGRNGMPFLYMPDF